MEKEIKSEDCCNSNCCQDETVVVETITNMELKDKVKQKYAAVATSNGSGCCGDPEIHFIGEEYTQQEGYVADADLGLGCGLPVEFAQLKDGMTVVDLGSGAGNDVFIARKEVGASGKVIGLDFTPEMIDKARKNTTKMGFDNVTFVYGEIENNPIPDETADVVVSNCVMNLVPNKEKAFSETYRIMKTGGHFSISDVVHTGTIPYALKQDIDSYTGCISGSVELSSYLKIIQSAGFKNIKIQKQREIQLPQTITSANQEDEFTVYSITVFAQKI